MPTLKIRELLSDESKWTQGSEAKGVDGFEVSSRGPHAVRFCLIGAMERCYGLLADDEYMHILERIMVDAGSGDIAHWNDAPERTFADVRALVERLDI